MAMVTNIQPAISPPSPKQTLTDFEEFVCGWGAAFINITVTFPINKVMFRQMLHGVATQKAVHQLRIEGYKYLYRGILPPLIQKTISVSVMFGTYAHYQQELKKFFPNIPYSVCWSTAALLAGTTEAILTPFERIQTLLQDKHYHKRFQNTTHAIRELRVYGLKEYYRGLSPILMRNGPSNVLFFGLREQVRSIFPETPNILGEVLLNFVSGAVVGGLISTVFYPVNVVKTHMQCRLGGNFDSFSTTFMLILKERGSLQRLFYGVHVNYTRALISWGIINASYELLKSFFSRGDVS